MKIKIFFLLIGLLLVYSAVAEDLSIGENRLGEFTGPVSVSGTEDQKKLDFQKGGVATLEYNVKIGDEQKSISIDYKKLQATEKGQPTITVDVDGNVIEGNFKTGEEGKYYLGGRILDLPTGTEVLITDGNVKIRYPEGEVLRNHEETERDLSSLSFESVDGKFNFGEENIVQIANLKYEAGGYYFDSGIAMVNGHFQAAPDKEGDKVFFDFKGEIDLDFKNGGYISLNKNKKIFVVGSNIDKRGPKVNFLVGNPYIRLRENLPQYEKDSNGRWAKIGTSFESFAVQPDGNVEGSYWKISPGEENRVPKIETLNQVIADVDSQSVFYSTKTGNLHWDPRQARIGGFKTGAASTPIEIHPMRTNEDKKEYVGYYKDSKGELVKDATGGKIGLKLGITDRVQWGYGPDPRYISTASTYGGEYSSLQHGFSNSLLYYNLKTPNDLQRFLGNNIRVIDNYGVLKDPENLRLMVDTFASLDPRQFRSISSVTFVGSLGGDTQAQGDSDGHITVAVAPGDAPTSGFTPNIIKHEIAHTYHYRGENMKQFWAQWTQLGFRPSGRERSGSPSNGFARGYGKSSWEEDVATYVEEALNPPHWKSVLQTSDPNYQIYRNKLTLLRDFGFIKQSEYDAIFAHAGVTL